MGGMIKGKGGSEGGEIAGIRVWQQRGKKVVGGVHHRKGKISGWNNGVKERGLGG